MRPNLLGMDMDFRVIPSAIPLQSPSPDRKTINVITPTISPNAIQIKKASTPGKFTRTEKQNNKSIHDMETQLKYHSHSDHPSALRQKDDIIKNLKNIIDMITQNSRHRKNGGVDEQQLKNEVKILTIENQKLVNIIDKMSKNKNYDQSAKISEYETKINDLQKTIKDNESFYNEEIKELKRFNKNLNSQFKSLEQQKKQLQAQNKKLLRVLKDRSEGQRFVNQKMKLSDTSEHSLDQKIHTMTSNKSQQKLSLIKIREQHSQNLKALKEGLVKQIQETFDTMKIAVDGMNSKINALAKRLESIEKLTWARVTKTHIQHVQRQSITISIKEEHFPEGGETDRSYRIQKKNNSQIYIEEGPSSSHERLSRDQFARLEDIPSQKNLISTLEQQLNATKTELNQLRFKYEKICLDTSQIAFSDREKLQNTSKLAQQYEDALQQIQKKQKQIDILYGQIRQIQEDYAVKQRKKQQQIQSYKTLIEKLRFDQEKGQEETQKQTELKLKLLVENYQKQILILHNEIKNLTRAKETYPHPEGPKPSIDQSLVLKVEELQAKNEQLSQLLKSSQQEVQAVQEKHQYEYKILQNALEEAQTTFQAQRKRKQQLEQESLLLISEINQNKSYIESLKYDLSAKNQQFQNMKILSGESQENYRNQLENNKNIRQLLIEREAQIAKYRKFLADWQSSHLVSPMQEINLLLQKTRETRKQTTTWQQKNKSQLQELIKERQENQSLRQHLIAKDEFSTHLEARISQLQNLYEITKNKLKEQQELYIQLMDKMTAYERTEQSRRIEVEIERTSFPDPETILQRIQEIQRLEEERSSQIKKILQDDPSRPVSY